MGKAQEFGSLHTLAAVYAEIGKATAAREVMIHGLDVAGQLEPEGNSWYVFGRIAEQYGLRDSALADYQRVDKPEKEEELPGSTWELARRRIAVLAKLD